MSTTVRRCLPWALALWLVLAAAALAHPEPGDRDGDDELRARDGAADQVDCGAGTDRVAADDADPALGCETVERAAPAADGSDLRLPGAGDSADERFAVRAAAAARQPLRRGRVVLAVTSTRVARLRATGTVRVGGRRLPLRPAAGRVKVAGGGIELRLRLPCGCAAGPAGGRPHHGDRPSGARRPLAVGRGSGGARAPGRRRPR